MKALTVRPTAWHYRLYRWWLATFEGRERRLDLCRYMRCLLLWIPLTLLLSALWYAGVGLTAPIWWPVVALVSWKADLLRLGWAWACAKKRRVCPLIEVEGA